MQFHRNTALLIATITGISTYGAESIKAKINNPGFEDVSQTKLVSARHLSDRWYFHGGPRPGWTLVEGKDGGKALKIMRGWATYDFKVTEEMKGKAIVVQLDAKGEGKIKLWLLGIDDKRKRVKISKWGDRKSNWTLPVTSEFLHYVKTSPEIPKGSKVKLLRIQIGCYKPYVIIDNMSITFGKVELKPWKSKLIAEKK